jgi:hypothetical protein
MVEKSQLPPQEIRKIAKISKATLCGYLKDFSEVALKNFFN